MMAEYYGVCVLVGRRKVEGSLRQLVVGFGGPTNVNVRKELVHV